MPLQLDPGFDDGMDHTLSQGVPADFRNAIMQGLGIPLSHLNEERDGVLYLRDILPICCDAGVTRIGDLTGLDRLGIPVAQAVRPQALSEVTSLGRGKTLQQAAIGALMEAMERAYAESIPSQRIFVASAEDLGVAEGEFDRLALLTRKMEWRQIETAWICGLDVATAEAAPVPLELVHTCYTEPSLPYDGLFHRTTTGLSCHRTGGNAFLHGLFECIERDAMARAFETHGFFERTRLSDERFSSETRRLLTLAAEQGVTAAFWAVPSPSGVPVVWCQTMETGGGAPLLRLPTEGYAAAPTLSEASRSALLEALVTRAAVISGVRDDLTAAHYRQNNKEIIDKARQLILEPSSAQNELPETPPLSSIRDIVESAITSGLGRVIAVPVWAGENHYCVRTILSGALSFSRLR